MSTLQFVHVACVAVYLWMAAYVLWRAPRLQRSLGFAAIAVCFAWWSCALVLAHSPDASAAQGRLGYDIGAIGWGSFGSLALYFALAFAGKRALLARTWVRLALAVPPACVIALQWRGALAATYAQEPWGWAYVWAASPWTFLFYAYYASYLTAALWIVLGIARSAPDVLVRRQASIIFFAALVPIVCSTTTDVVLPWLGHHELPNIAPAFLLAWTGGIAVAIVRYRLLEISPETAADQIVKAMSDGLVLVDPQDRIVTWNPAATAVFARGSELRGARLGPLLAARVSTTRKGEHAEDLQLESPTGPRTVSLSRSEVRDARDELLGSVYLFRDISERVRAEVALREAHDQLEQRVAARTRELEEAYAALQRFSRVLVGLHASVDAIHKSTELAEIAQKVADAVPTAFAPGAVLGCRVTLDSTSATSQAFAASPASERVAITAAGTERGALELYRDAGHGPLAAEETQLLARVATELGQALEGAALEHAIAQADRLASVGVLAAGVAHEINNPLTYLMTGLYEIEAALVDSPQTELLARAQEAILGGDRITKIVRELGAFARHGDAIGVQPIGKQIDAAVAMSAHQIKHRARLVVEQTSAGAVRADPGRLTQVFLNLLVNAAHAFVGESPERNTITVRTFDDATHAVIEVRDNGRGIEAADLPHVFDLFFTTKAVGEGSGLGLAICQKIVRAAGGEIAVTSRVGEGTTFVVRLPLARAVPETPAPAPPVAAPARTPAADAAPARILIVDDEPLVAGALGRLLDEHATTIVTSAAAAKALLDADAAFDLVLCDLMMPDVPGWELYAWIAEHHPRLGPRVMFMTGGTFTPEAARFRDAHGGPILAKPFDVRLVCTVIDDTLARLRA